MRLSAKYADLREMQKIGLAKRRLRHETFCIADALVSACRGDWENGLFFCGSNVSKVKSIMKVKELMQELVSDFRPREPELEPAG